MNHETELDIGVDMSEKEGRLFKKEPAINVISKQDFEERVGKVFHLLWKTLSKSFGPYGAPTIIYNHPYSHVTKDGYTIMKNTSMDASETLVDQAIANMASDICGRLNYTVGDGTTSAIIATNSIYQNYLKQKKEFQNNFILPRDIISQYVVIKDQIIERLREKVVPIRTTDPEQLKKNIHDVVYISSNGDEVITEYISDLYREIGAPGISCMIAPDGITKKKLITGYRYNLTLNDRLYINNDNQTMELHNADVIILGVKVNRNNYESILKPLNEECKTRGRNLIVCAPSYDEIAIAQHIAPELNREFNLTKKVNMVLTTYRANSAASRKLLEDFAVLMNTTVIDRVTENMIMSELASGAKIGNLFNIDGRHIEGIFNVAVRKSDSAGSLYKYGENELPDEYAPYEELIKPNEDAAELGFVNECFIGLKDGNTQFTKLQYNEARYNKIVEEATYDLEEKEKKYQKLGTFNLEVSQAQDRLYSLKLKMGIIEVGGDSELSQKLLKDSVDDAIKAASSAYYNGVVKGCNTNLLTVIYELLEESRPLNDDLNSSLLRILLYGFMDVYRTVLDNGFKELSEKYTPEDSSNIDSLRNGVTLFCNAFGKTRGNINVDSIFRDKDKFEEALKVVTWYYDNPTIHDVIICYSILTGEVFDVSKFEFSKDVINSFQTDEQILTATIDLISLLIVGNQIVVTQKHNF